MPRPKNPETSAPAKARPRKRAAATAERSRLSASFVGSEQRAALIAEAAFFRAESRGFAPGHEQADWLAAEAEVDAKLLRRNPVPG